PKCRARPQLSGLRKSGTILMTLFNIQPTELTPEQISRRKRIQAKGRKRYILDAGILRFGVPLFLIMTLWRWHDTYRWHLPPRGGLSIVCAAIAFSLAVLLTAGYFFGVTMWKRMRFEDSSGVESKRTSDR